MRRALLFVTAAAALLSCGKNHLMAEVDGAVVPECDQSVAAEDGPTLVIQPESHEELYKLPTGPIVRVAADRGVSWRRINALVFRLQRQGSRPVLLVGRGATDEIRAFEPTQPLHPGKHLVLDTSRDGGFYLGAADSTTGTRVQSFDHLHISKSSIREIMGPLVKQTGIHDVEVRVDPHLNWVDMVRAVDGSRTCCPGEEMRATLVE